MAASLRELGMLFARLGLTTFGGPAAHVAVMRTEVVERRGWLTEGQFLDLLGAANLIPGPTSTELAIHIGWEQRRFAGLVVAGGAFIIPAVLTTLAFAALYVEFGALPASAGLLRGVKPVVFAVVVQAISKLGTRAIPSNGLRVLAVAAFLAGLAGLDELVMLFLGGLAVMALRGVLPKGALLAPAAVPAAALPAAGVIAGPVALTLPALFLVFAKIGTVLFGSGYVLLAFLRSELVERLGWLTEAQLIDAVAVGQLTPGPLFSTATFLGYVLAGWKGAVAATVGIFLPAFTFVALSGPLLPYVRRSVAARAFLDGVNVASLALMAVVTVQIGQAALIDLPTVGLAVVAAALLLRTRVNSAWLVLGGGAAGYFGL
jgi:chromate transporter